MKARLVYLLKHNRAIQRLYTVIMSAIFCLMSNLLKKDDCLILFVSFMGKGVNDSPKAIYDYLTAHPEFGQYHCVWGLENPTKHPEVKSVKIDTFSYFRTAMKARYWVTNTNIERGLHFKPKGTVYLNTWHGIALKKIGNDCPGRKDFDFSNVDHLVVSGNHDERVFRTAFQAREESYLRCGMPRNDALWQANDETRYICRKKLGISENVKVILYAPTWRDSEDGGRTYKISLPVNFDRWREMLGQDWLVLLRAHHQTTTVMNIQFNDFVRNVSDWSDVNELIIASDILITDYSAIAFDYSITGKPIFCYVYDIDTYLMERGTYFDMDSVYPNVGCRKEDELLHEISSLDMEKQRIKTLAFRDRFIQYGGEAAEACVQALLLKRQ